MYINQQDAQISVIKLYFPLDALHVSDYISASSGATFYKMYIVFGIFGYVWLLWGYSHIGIYWHIPMRCTAYKVAPDDGLIQSETCRASNGK